MPARRSLLATSRGHREVVEPARLEQANANGELHDREVLHVALLVDRLLLLRALGIELRLELGVRRVRRLSVRAARAQVELHLVLVQNADARRQGCGPGVAEGVIPAEAE